MPEMRQDPLSGDWVIFAPDRRHRPSHLDAPRPEETPQSHCPFCPGHESMTPPEIMVRHAPDKSGWMVRVFPNRYPALRVEGTVDARPDGFFDRMNGVGAHEVVVITPDHAARPAALSAEQWRVILDVIQARILDLRGDGRLKHIQVFQNHGHGGGATQPHAHAQLVALPVVPPRVNRRSERMRGHFERRGRCLICDLLSVELEERSRVFLDDARVVGFVPYAAPRSFTMWLVPQRHGARFEEAPADVLNGIAAALPDCLGRMDRLLERPDYQLVLHSAPFRGDGAEWRHWFIEILPVLTGTGGFEHATGCLINTVFPEEAAKALAQA